jgi:hypothetical protein
VRYLAIHKINWEKKINYSKMNLIGMGLTGKAQKKLNFLNFSPAGGKVIFYLSFIFCSAKNKR